jgi:hypothetical protein
LALLENGFTFLGTLMGILKGEIERGGSSSLRGILDSLLNTLRTFDGDGGGLEFGSWKTERLGCCSRTLFMTSLAEDSSGSLDRMPITLPILANIAEKEEKQEANCLVGWSL